MYWRCTWRITVTSIKEWEWMFLHGHANVHEYIWFMNHAHMILNFVCPNCVFGSVSGTHSFIWSVRVFVASQFAWVELKELASASQEDKFNTALVCSQDSTGNPRRQKTPGTCFLIKPLKKKQTPDWEGREFFTAGLHDVKRFLWSSPPLQDWLSTRDRGIHMTIACTVDKKWSNMYETNCKNGKWWTHKWQNALI